MEETLLVVPSAAESTSSGSGISYWWSYFECPRRDLLDKQFGDNWGLDKDGEPKLDAAKVGVLVHKLLEFYYQGLLTDGVALEYQDSSEDREWVEALRLFSAYKKVYPPNEWEVVSTEQPIAFGCKACRNDAWSENPEYIKDAALEAVRQVGVPYLTGRYDMIVRVREEHVEVLKQTRKILLQPGIYIVDTKTKTQKMQTFVTEMHESVQFHAYMKLFKILHPDLYPELRGTLANVIFRYVELDVEKRAKKRQDSPFQTVFIPRSTIFKEQWVRDILNEAWKRRTLLGENAANPRECFSFGRECPHFTAGHCSRI